MTTLKNDIAFALCPKQAFIAFVAADRDLLRILAAGEKACMMSENAVRHVVQRTDLIANRRMKWLAKSLYNPNGHCYERGKDYVGDLRRYRHILDRCVRGSERVPDGREQYANMMDAVDEAIDAMLQKLFYAITNECYRKGHKESRIIAELSIANCMCHVAGIICDLYKEKARGNEYVLCADPRSKALRTTNTLLAGYRSYLIQSRDYFAWAQILDNMVGVLAPQGVCLRKEQAIDDGLTFVVRKMQDLELTIRAATDAGLHPLWADQEGDSIQDDYLWLRYKPSFQM